LPYLHDHAQQCAAVVGKLSEHVSRSFSDFPTARWADLAASRGTLRASDVLSDVALYPGTQGADTGPMLRWLTQACPATQTPIGDIRHGTQGGVTLADSSRFVPEFYRQDDQG